MPYTFTEETFWFDQRHGYVSAETWNRLKAHDVARFLLDAERKGFVNCIPGFRDTLMDTVDWKIDAVMGYTIDELVEAELSAQRDEVAA